MTKTDFDDIDKDKQEKITGKILVGDTVVALADDPKSCESFYLKKITKEEKEKMGDTKDGFGHVIKNGMKHLEQAF